MLKLNLNSSVSKDSLLKSFRRSNSGNVAIIFGLAVIPIFFAAGIAIDYSRAADAQASMQAASDAAAISAVLDKTLPSCEAKQGIVQISVEQEMIKKPWVIITGPVSIITDGGCKVSFPARVNTSLLATIGQPIIDISVTSTAVAVAGKNLEIAVALDNTGSMFNEMGSLKTAATNFATTMFSKGTGPGQVKIGLVPFVATVNPGKAFINNASMSDFNADSVDHGYLLNGGHSHRLKACTPTAIGAPATNPGTGSGADSQSWLEDIFGKSGNKFAHVANELIGIKVANAMPALGTMAPTDSSISTSWTPYTFGTFTAPLPGGVNTGGTNFGIWEAGCALENPKVNLFDLFARLPAPATGWKGCVMARPHPYDVNAEGPNGPPSGAPDSKFVPFFWPSEYAKTSTIHDPANPYKNNYIANEPTPVVFPDPAFYNKPTEGQSVYSLFKYNGTTNGGTLTVQENANLSSTGETWGPNKSCPNEVTPLNSDLPTILSEINKLSHWEGGGTITSEGLMWAWRVLSPSLPYGPAVTSTLGGNYWGGAAYADSNVKKYIVLMTDGVNAVQTNGPTIAGQPNKPNYAASEIWSDVTAYGALGYAWIFGKSTPNTVAGGFGTQRFDEAEAMLNERFTTACTNAKAQGITVFTIYFDHPLAIFPDPSADAAARAALTTCSGADKFYSASNGAQLNSAFQRIAASIGETVRLTK